MDDGGSVATLRAELKEPGLVGAVEQGMESDRRPVLSATESRQAVRGHGVRYVLAISVTLAVAAMVIAYLVA